MIPIIDEKNLINKNLKEGDIIILETQLHSKEERIFEPINSNICNLNNVRWSANTLIDFMHKNKMKIYKE